MNLIGDVKGKNVILLDDMIDTAGTIVNLANALKSLEQKMFMLVVLMVCYQVQLLKELLIQK